MKKRNFILPLVALIGILPFVTSCNNQTGSSSFNGNNSSSEGSQLLIPVESVSLTINNNILKVGESRQLVTEILPATATNKMVTYSASNDCVEISETGVVTAKKSGTCSVSVTTNDNNKTDSVELEVIEDDPNKNLSVSQLVEKLSESPYSNGELTSQEKYGLTDEGLVGVNQDLIVEKYPVKKDADMQSESIIKFNDIQLSQVQKYFKDGTLNNYYRLQTAIYLAKELNDAGKEAKIKLPSGEIELEAYLSDSSQTLSLNGLNGTYIEGDNTSLVIITNDLNWKGYFAVDNCKNLYLNGITLDAKLPSSLTGKIVAGDINNNKLTIEVDHEFDPLVKKLITNKKSIRSWVEFGQINRTPLEGGNFLVDAFKTYDISGDESTSYQIEVTFSNAGISRPRNGTLVAVSFSQYDAVGISITNSENVYLEGITMHHASGMALTSSSTSNLYVNRFNLSLKENSASLMTATADAMHFNSMNNDVQITNSLIENSHDDAMNIKHGYWYKLTAAEGGSTKSMSVAKITSAITEPQVGDKIAVYNEQTFEGHNPTNGYYTIQEVTKTSVGYDFKVKERMSNVGEWGNCRVTFLSNTPKLVFSNNIIRNKRNRGVLIQVPDAVIENNTFMNVGHGAIQAASSMDVYNEATLAQNITIKNNKFINNCYIKPEPLYGDISIFAISNNGTVAQKGTLYGATIENNFIAKNGNASISLRGVGDSNINDNLFYDCSYIQPSGDSFNTLLQCVNCEDIVLDGNYNYYTLDKGLSGVTFEGNSSPNDISINDSNYNIAFKANGEAGPEVDIKATTKTINVNGELSDWENNEITNIDILGISDAEGSARTAEELKDHFAINKLMMTYNEKGIYLGFDVFDNLLNVKTVSDFWLGDCVELFMSTITDMPSADMQVYKEKGGVLQAAFAPTWTNHNYFTFSDVRTNPKYINDKSKVEVAFTSKSDGYVGEVLIPFELAPEFKQAIDDGKQIDIAIIVADAERQNEGLKRVQMGNIPHFVEDNKTKTARMTQYYFK